MNETALDQGSMRGAHLLISSLDTFTYHASLFVMSDNKQWLDLLGPVPAQDGECRRRVMHDPAHEDWVEVRVVLGGGQTGQRVVTAMFDADDQPGVVSDVVTIPGGRRQEAVSAQVVTGGRIQGTYLLSENDQKTPRPLTETEVQRLRTVFAALRKRYP
jgi:hypothetical protein